MEGRRKEGGGGGGGRWRYTGDCGGQYDLCTFGDALRKVLWAQKILVVHDNCDGSKFRQFLEGQDTADCKLQP